ncbi:metal ABC transporter solute-binding protein, Zn/Mn family [Roseimaritima sediminicola]|uniref:metal ABC transporter solute-binding protein, Zn/Mn family n=1 Tax=Roseimaritima sediminicola TaxID=2662066 RepID=UPI0012984553|nr:zinc ABC transporter substrate-binding protein [Roseimaritima sediminicola]
MLPTRRSPLRLRFASALLTLVALSLIGCGRSSERAPQRSSSDPIRVTATVGMVADIVRQVGGPHVEVTQICGPGVDPHLYKVTRDDARLLSDADMIFYSGLMLEGKMSDTLVKMARQRPVVAVTEAVDPDLLLEPEAMQGHYDPHVWMDVSAWSECVAAVQEALADAAPQHADTFAENAAAYREQLDRLHRYAQQTIGSIPENSRVLITSHDAFNYLGRAYGLDVQGVQGLSTESEAGLQRVNELVDLLVERDVKAVFIESSVPRKSIDALIEGAQSRGHEVVVGGELYSDAMGPEGTYQGTYIGMLDHNVTTITQALGGEAPEGGMQGKLER